MQLSGKKYKRKKSELGRLWMGISWGPDTSFMTVTQTQKCPGLWAHIHVLCAFHSLVLLNKYCLFFVILKDTKFMQMLVYLGVGGFLKLDFLSLIFSVMAPNYMFRTIFSKSKCKTLDYRCCRCGLFKTPDLVFLALRHYAVTMYKTEECLV